MASHTMPSAVVSQYSRYNDFHVHNSYSSTCTQQEPTMDFGQCHTIILAEDILLYIFELGVKLDTRLALKLTHVCRHWRSICLASSFLWSHVYVVNYQNTALLSPPLPLYTWNDAPSHRKTPPDFQQLQHYLFHSRTTLLDFTVDIRRPHNTDVDDGDKLNDTARKDHFFSRSTMIAALLSKHSHRVRSLKVTLDTYADVSMFLSQFQWMRRWESLEECQLNWTGPAEDLGEIPEMFLSGYTVTLFNRTGPRYTDSSRSLVPPICPPLDLFPSLRKVSIRGLYVDWDVVALVNLEELNLSDMNDSIKPSFRQLRALLVANQATLKTLSLVDVFTFLERDAAENPTEFTLPVLDTLTFGYTHCNALQCFTILANLPALKNLTIRCLYKLHDIDNLEVAYNSDQARYMRLQYPKFTYPLFREMCLAWPLHNLDSITLQNVRLTTVNCIRQPTQSRIRIDRGGGMAS